MNRPKPNLEPPKRVGIWIRVSTEDAAKGDSPELHEKRAREYCRFEDWEVVEVYDLSGVSGKTIADHPQTLRMRRDIASGRIQALVFSKLARLARNTRELLELSDYFRKHNADIVSIQERIDTSTPAGRLFYTIIAAMAQWEREEIVERIKASITMRAKLGKSLGGTAPFGFRWQDKRLIIDAEESPVRKLMYELFLKHRRIKTVARLLNEKGYRTREGARFSDTTVTRLIQDPSAKGLYRSNHTRRDEDGKLVAKPKSEWVFHPVEPIVKTELWEQCNDIIRLRREGKTPGRQAVHLFAGLLVCGCGRKMYVFSRTNKYICSKCRNKVAMEEMEELFRQELRNYFVSKDKLRKHLDLADQFLVDKRQQFDGHVQQLQNVRTEMDKIYRLYVDGELSSRGFGERNRPLEARETSLAAELPKLEAEIAALEAQRMSADEVIEEATQLHRLWPTLSAEDRRRIIESITERIVITADRVEIYLYGAPCDEGLTKRQRRLWGSLLLPA